MSITSDRVVNRLIKNLTRNERQQYTKAQYIAYLDAAAFVLVKLQKERHTHAPSTTARTE